MTNSKEKSIVLNETKARYCVSVIQSVRGYVMQQNTKTACDKITGQDMYVSAHIECLDKLEQELYKVIGFLE